MGRLQLALDIGGTFTDVVMVDGASGALWTAKTPSTPRDPSDGFFEGVEKILRLAGTAPADVAAVFHGFDLDRPMDGQIHRPLTSATNEHSDQARLYAFARTGCREKTA